MRRLKLLKVILLMILFTLPVMANNVSNDARHLYFQRLRFQSVEQFNIVQTLLFPEQNERSLNALDPNQKWRLLKFACDIDLNIISFAEKNQLDYDRSWLVYWLPKSGKVLTPVEYVTLLYYASFMPPLYRGIIDQDYELTSHLPDYRKSLINGWDVDFRMHSNGYVYDAIGGEWVFNPEAAEASILRLRKIFADDLGL